MARRNVAGPMFGFLTLIFCFVSIACFFLKAWLAFTICLILCLVSLAVFARLRFKEFANFFVSRQLRYGTNVALSILGVISIAVFVNVIVVQRFDKRVDLTELRFNSLSEQTMQILKKLDKKVQVIAFFKDTHPQMPQAKHWLELYQHETKFITVSFKDPDIENTLAEKYNIERDGTTIFDDEKRQEKVTVVDEQKFTSALLKIIQNKTKNVYFLEGHGEHDINDLSNMGYSDVKEELENQNYAVFSHSFLTQSDIPGDCELLVIAGPKNGLSPNEIRLIEKYLAQNGKLLLLLNPSSSAQDINKGLVQLMKKWGVAVGNDLVIDVHKDRYDVLQGPSAPVPGFVIHDITKVMRYPLSFPYTRSVTPIEDRKADLSVKSIAETISPVGFSWGETQRKQDGTFGNYVYNPGVDTPGPVSIAVAVEKKINESTETGTGSSLTRIVVFGDSDFAAKFFFGPPSRDLFLATVNWLTEEEDLIAIRPIDPSKQVLRRMTDQDAGLVRITSVFLIPLIVFIAGIVVWWLRREGGTA